MFYFLIGSLTNDLAVPAVIYRYLQMRQGKFFFAQNGEVIVCAVHPKKGRANENTTIILDRQIIILN